MKNRILINKATLLGCIYTFFLTFYAFGQSTNTEGEVKEVDLSQSQTELIVNDSINLGFNKRSKKDVIGSVSSIRPASYLEYDNTQWVRDALYGRITGLYGSDNIRGLGNALIVVDGIPGRSIDLLNSEEIEQITVLKDASAIAQYGAMGRNGVIVVTTKRGSSNFRRANVILSYGTREPISLPKYLGSADYMQFYNEARLNDGLDSAFSLEQINNFRNSTNPYRYPDVNFYSSDYLKSRANYTNILTEFSGGSENTRYYINLGYIGAESLMGINPSANGGTNRFNVRGNIDFKVNDFISSSLDVVSIISSTKTAQNDLLYQGTIRKPHIFAPLLPISMIDTVGNPVLKGQVDAANIYNGSLLGGSQAFQNNNPVADILAGGYREYISRVTQVNNAVDFDLSRIAKGLSAKSYISFDFYNTYALSVNNTFSVYEPTWNNDSIVSLNRLGNQDRKDLTENANTQGFITRFGFYGMLNYERKISEKHGFNTSLIGFANNTFIRNQEQPQKNAHIAFQAVYNYDGKAFLDFSSAYVNSVKLAEGNRTKFSPTIGVSYVLSEEGFLSNSSWIDYLKVRASTGIVNSDIGIADHFMYREVYAQTGGGYSWADGFNNQATRILQGQNNLLDYEQRKDINIGFEAVLFNNVWIEANAFRTDIDNQITKRNNEFPSFYQDFTPFSNYNSDRYKGVELGFNLSEKIGEVRADIGARIMYTNSERLKVDEKYNDTYQNREGLPLDLYWGLEDQGFYGTADFTQDGELVAGLPVPAYGDVRPGDIRYKDQNNDGVVNDQDEINIGRWQAPWTFGTNLRLSYRGLSFFVLGVGESGNQGMLNNDYYWVDGDDKYSEVVLNRWTEDNASSATFPRLSSQRNNNNFRNSTFWLYSNSFFRIQRAQLTYSLPAIWVDKISMENISIYVAGSNLVEIAENRKERQLLIGSDPMYRYFSVGLRAKF